MIVVALIIATVSSSCVRFVPQGQGGVRPYTQNPQGFQEGLRQAQQGGGQQRSLKPYYPGQKPAGRVQVGTKQVQTGTKRVEIARFEARLWGSEDAALKQQATDYAARYFEKHRKPPSNEEVSGAIGHRCQVRRIR